MATNYVGAAMESVSGAKTAAWGIEASGQRHKLLPIPQTTIAANATVDVNVTATKAIQLRRLVLESDAALFSDLECVDIRVNGTSMFQGAGGFPLSALSPLAVGVGIQFAPLKSSGILTVTVRNTTAGALHVAGLGIGVGAEN